MEPVPKRYSSHKCLEPKGECTKNYVDKQKSGTKDLTLDTAKKRLSGREKQIADALKDAGA